MPWKKKLEGAGIANPCLSEIEMTNFEPQEQYVIS
jgi:hypothetical protein